MAISSAAASPTAPTSRSSVAAPHSSPGAHDYAPGGKPFTGRKMLFTMLAFFGVITAVNAVMITFAVSGFGGLVTPNSYVASQQFERDRAVLKTQAIHRWRIESRAATTGAGPSAVLLTIADESGAPLDAPTLEGWIGRPTHGRVDQAVAFTAVAPGLFRSHETFPRGAWRLTLFAPAQAAATPLETAPAERRTVRVFLPRAAAPASQGDAAEGRARP